MEDVSVSKKISMAVLSIQRDYSMPTMNEAQGFDVFLCHNSLDKPEVREIGYQLQKEEIMPWFDEWELIPGQPWQRALERQIAGIKSAAVFFGAHEIRDWQWLEAEAFLREFVRHKD